MHYIEHFAKIDFIFINYKKAPQIYIRLFSKIKSSFLTKIIFKLIMRIYFFIKSTIFKFFVL